LLILIADIFRSSLFFLYGSIIAGYWPRFRDDITKVSTETFLLDSIEFKSLLTNFYSLEVQ